MATIEMALCAVRRRRRVRRDRAMDSAAAADHPDRRWARCSRSCPAFASVRLDPDIFFLLFVPPLLFSDGWLFPKREFLSYLRPILLLAFGLVAATVVVVGYLMHWLIPSLPLAAAFALGAIVSPTDAVATAAVTERLPLPSRVTHVVNGEIADQRRVRDSSRSSSPSPPSRRARSRWLAGGVASSCCWPAAARSLARPSPP